ncbi:3-ketoacyl-CoA synthase 21 [Perilla frutescens var. hirtella]|uniref:3-ketoacyl-CoA synthase n=1 Tax=Perilla frutescens var. hirtella TaxID=608512 RepID=A0AAD4JF16_PERFH|nr:3-ketoacyl-CoA synthase 21 [Perilla frutescens var. hirtella]
MAITLLHSFSDLTFTNNFIGLASILVASILYLTYRKKTTICLLDYACYKPPPSYRAPMSLFVEHLELEDELDQDSVDFQIKILEKSGFGEETSVPPALTRLPIDKSISFSIDETQTVVFSVVKELLQKTNIHPREIDILITNSCMFCPTPSLSAQLVNKFIMRSNIMSFNLSGMGCSAGIVSVGLARDLLRVHRNSLALIVSSETMNLNWYTGKNRSMLLTNCLFRLGGAAILMSSRDQDKNRAKYGLQHLERTNRAQDDQSYTCILQELDKEKKLGVSISKNTVTVAGQALKANMAVLGPKVLPLTEQFRYGLFLLMQKMKISRKGSLYIPNFRKAFKHFCIHPGGRSVISAIQKSLKMQEEDIEASRMTLYRFGNTSSSSIWYELSYIEAKGRMRKGDRVWQVAVGSGFKCNSAVWKCLCNIKSDETNVWSDRIHSYPVQIPETIKIL